MTNEDYWRAVEIIAEAKNTSMCLGIFNATAQAQISAMEWLLAKMTDTSVEVVDCAVGMWMEVRETDV